MVGYQITKTILSKLLLISFLLAFMPVANAGEVVADSVSESSTPPINTNPACASSVGVTSNGSTAGTDGYCVKPTVSSSYEITYTFTIAQPDKTSGIMVWANAGSIYTDGELRSFDMEVDYKKADGTSATLVMNGVNIGDTTSVSDPKTVTFMDGGVAVELLEVSEVRISNLGGVSPEYAFRELKAKTITPEVELKTVISLTSGSVTPDVGDSLTYKVKVTNRGELKATGVSLTSKLPAGLTLTSSSVPQGSYDSITGVWSGFNVPSGGTKTLTLIGTVDAGQEGNTITTSTTAADNIKNDASIVEGDVLSHDVEVTGPALTVVKTASLKTNVAAGVSVTYTYVVTNTGDQPISNVSLSDAHNGSGPTPVPANETLTVASSGSSTDAGSNGTWDMLGVGDEVTFTASYVVTQNDIDTLQ